MLLLLSMLLLIAALLSSHVALAGPVRVFVLAGQSNMVGPASSEHLHQLVTNTTNTSSEYAHLWSGNNWTQQSNVFIKFEERFGNLTVGYGYNGNFGPELEFGWGLSQALNGDKVLLIKTAWGGRSLAIEFRPPSSGVGNYSYCDTQTQKCFPYRPLDYGTLYRLMVSEVQQALTNIDLYVPGYNKSQGYVLSGFVWFQGWSDLGDWSMVGEYRQNLINLIDDIRKDLNAPNLPVIIGELGQGGADPPTPDKDKILAIRKIEQEVALLKGDHARFVKTSIFVDNEAQRFDGIHHYWGRADTFCHIGRAFRETMLELIQSASERNSFFQLIGYYTSKT